MNPIDDVSLAHQAQKGDLDAFNRLVLAYQDIAFNLSCRILSDSDAAADATQVAFISAYRNIHQYRGGSFRAWLLRIVTNNCYDELRRLKRRPTIPLEVEKDDGEDESENAPWLKDNKPAPEEEALQSDLRKAIQHCLQDLPDEFRTVMVLVEMEGLDYQEAAQVTHKPEGTIKSRLARGRLRMRECLSKFQELLPEKNRLIGEERL